MHTTKHTAGFHRKEGNISSCPPNIEQKESIHTSIKMKQSHHVNKQDKYLTYFDTNTVKKSNVYFLRKIYQLSQEEIRKSWIRNLKMMSMGRTRGRPMWEHMVARATATWFRHSEK